MCLASGATGVTQRFDSGDKGYIRGMLTVLIFLAIVFGAVIGAELVRGKCRQMLSTPVLPAAGRDAALAAEPALVTVD